MNLRKELLGGLVSLLLSAGIVFGSFSLALIETKAVKITAHIPSATPQPTLERPTVPAGSPTLTLEPTNTFTIAPTPIPPTNCPPPPGWQVYTTRRGDTLDSLATEYNSTKEDIMRANCMVVGGLSPGSTIYLPAATPSPSPTLTSSLTLSLTPSFTPTKISCSGPPRGWIPYTIRSGNTLFHLAWAYGISVYEIQAANCMGVSTLLVAGNIIYVPNVATRTVSPTPATPTAIPSSTLTHAPTITPITPLPPDESPTPTITPTSTTTITETITTPTVDTTLPAYPSSR